MYVLLNEGYLRAANRGSKNLQIFIQNITYQPSMQRRFFWSVFFTVTKLLRLFSGNLSAMFYFLIRYFEKWFSQFAHNSV